MKVKFNFSNFFHFNQCHSEAKNSCNSRTKGDMTLRFWLFSYFMVTVKISKESVTMMYPDLPNLPGLLRKWLLNKLLVQEESTFDIKTYGCVESGQGILPAKPMN